MLEKLFKKLLPTVKADDEDIVDPQQVLRDECRETHHCQELAKKLDECNQRVNSRSQTAEICSEELFDLFHAIDHCVTPKLFAKLK